MTRMTPSIKEDVSVDKDAIKSHIKYLRFGIKLWTLREKNKIRSKDMAERLGLSFQEYRRYESGEALPDKNIIKKIASILHIDEALFYKLQEAEQKARKPKVKTITGAERYLYHWDVSVAAFKKDWKEHHDPNNKHDVLIKEVLHNLKKEVCTIKTLPILPLGLYLILDIVLNEQYKGIQSLSDVTDFVVKNESLPSYIARDPFLGPFLFIAANCLYFFDAPYKNIEECLENLDLDRFSDLIFMATQPEGLYVNYEQLPALQQYIEFSSLGVLMARELKKVLPENINYDHLYAAALMQSLGTYALNTLLYPIIDNNPIWSEITNTEKEEKDLKSSLMQHLNWEFHPVISAMIAANWNFPEEVIQTLLEHHKQPVAEVSPACAALKLINFFVDCDFPRMNKTEIVELLAKHPQIDIKPDVLAMITRRMHNLSESLLEMSSLALSSQSPQKATDNIVKDIETIDFASDPICSKMIWTHSKTDKAEFRFDSEYSKVLCLDCGQRLNLFLTQKLSPKKGETIRAFGERMQNIYLALNLILSGNPMEVSARYQLPIEEIGMRLKL
jgi:transcriptional regulator with XRE-family HTH domain